MLDLARARELRLSNGVVRPLPRRQPTHASPPRSSGCRSAFRRCSPTAAATTSCRSRSASASRGARRRDADRRARRGPLRPPRSREPAVEGGHGMALTRERRAALDAADPLAGFRERFVIADEHRLYLDGNSLGRLPKAHARAAARGDRPVGRRSWSAAGRSGSRRRRAPATRSPRCSAPSPGEVLVADSTTVNLYKLVNALLDADPSLRTLVTDADNFPTDRYVLEGIAARPRPGAADLRERRPARTARSLAMLPDGPDRALARRLPLGRAGRHGGARRAAATRRSGTSATPPARSRSTSRAAGIRYAVGCTYKYLNAGPGARRATCTSPQASRTRCARPIQGWFGQDDQFAMERPYEPARRHRPLPRRHAADPRAGRGRGGRADHRRGGDRGAAREVDRARAS